MAKYSSDVTGGVFWVGILVGFIFVLILATQRYGTTRSFAFGSFGGMVGSMYLATMKLMPWWIATVFILIGAGGIVSLLINEKNS